MTRILRIASLVIAAFLVLPSARAEDPLKPVVIPFELLKTGHMTVKVKVNDKGPYTLIFDTGAPINLFNNKIAKDADLLKGVAKPPIAIFGSMGEVKVKMLEIGALKAEDLPGVVMDHPTVEAISKALGPIDGIIGFPFFARYKMTLDYQAKTMTLVPSGFKPPDVMKSMMLALMTSDQGPRVLSPSAQWGIVPHKDAGDDDAGVTIKAVVPDSAAAKAGLKTGDRLLTLDGRWTDTLPDLYTAVSHVKAGTTATVVIKRDGKEMKLQVKPVSGL
jgi:membrane-associated protease RseP (regulator of RpoE activity)